MLNKQYFIKLFDLMHFFQPYTDEIPIVNESIRDHPVMVSTRTSRFL